MKSGEVSRLAVGTTTPLRLAGQEFSSRLLVGTGKYRDLEQTRAAITASGAEIVTVSIRRSELAQGGAGPGLLDILPPERFVILPNTAGCYSVEEALHTARLARELLDGHRLLKLEVLGDPATLFPNVTETLKATERLVAEDFAVMVYTSDDPVVARQLEEAGCTAIMPLASLIGSGMGLLNPWNLQIIIANASVPVIVDAGVGTASDAAIAMELGCDAVLCNTAIAEADDPVRMATAIRHAVIAGRLAWQAGRMPKRPCQAVSSSPPGDPAVRADLSS